MGYLGKLTPVAFNNAICSKARMHSIGGTKSQSLDFLSFFIHPDLGAIHARTGHYLRIFQK